MTPEFTFRNKNQLSRNIVSMIKRNKIKGRDVRLPAAWLPQGQLGRLSWGEPQ